MSGLVGRLLSAAGFKPFYNRDDDKFVNDIAKARHEITRDDYGPSWLAIKSNHRGNVRREVRTAINALLTCGYFPLAQSDMREAADEITRLTARVAELEGAGRDIMPYLRWTISDESPGHHPTMPSAIAAFREALEPKP